MPSPTGKHSDPNSKAPSRHGFVLYFKALTAIMSLVFLSACNQLATQPSSQEKSTELAEARSNTSPQFIESLLEAEFTLQREGAGKAFEPFYKLANQSRSLPLIERLTQISLITQNPQNIERSANLWLATAPTTEPAYALKLQIVVKEGRVRDTADLLTQAMQYKIPLSFLPVYLDNHVRDSEQINTISQALPLLPSEAKQNRYIQLSQARLAFLTGHYDAAKQLSQKLINDREIAENEALYLILAYSQEKLGQTPEAIKTLEVATKRFPKSLRLQTPLIDFLVRNQQSKEALKYYRESSLDEKDKLQAGINFTGTLLEYKHPVSALEALKLLPKRQLGFKDQILYLKAITFGQLNRLDDAIETMDMVKGALRSDATNRMAFWLYNEGRENTINDMVLRRTLRENTPEQVLTIYQLHEEKGHLDLALELLNKALLETPESDVLRYRKALLSDTLGNWQDTEKELTLLLNKDPSNPQYLNALGYTLLTRTDRIDEAMKYIESAYEKAESDPAIIDSLGWGFFLKNELEQASYYLEKAWSILPDAEIGAHYGESLWKQNHHEQAISIWIEALEAAPNTPLLLDTIKRLSPSLLKDMKLDTTP
ncbi:tetratricopeptide repeat protein [Marinomonas transparens]|nr:tetratricopeptide repeat protein [Marinomonas transparens]